MYIFVNGICLNIPLGFILDFVFAQTLERNATLSALGKVYIHLFYFKLVSTSGWHIRVLSDAVSSGSAVVMLMGQCREHKVALRIRYIICTHWHRTERDAAHTLNVYLVKSQIGWRYWNTAQIHICILGFKLFHCSFGSMIKVFVFLEGKCLSQSLRVSCILDQISFQDFPEIGSIYLAYNSDQIAKTQHMLPQPCFIVALLSQSAKKFHFVSKPKNLQRITEHLQAITFRMVLLSLSYIMFYVKNK